MTTPKKKSKSQRAFNLLMSNIAWSLTAPVYFFAHLTPAGFWWFLLTYMGCYVFTLLVTIVGSLLIVGAATVAEDSLK